MGLAPRPQGWYGDPYQLHEDRYFSAGEPTKLVRDGGIESYDAPPEGPMPEGRLSPAVAAAPGGPDDVRRVGGGGAEPYCPDDYFMAALDVAAYIPPY